MDTKQRQLLVLAASQVMVGKNPIFTPDYLTAALDAGDLTTDYLLKRLEQAGQDHTPPADEPANAPKEGSIVKRVLNFFSSVATEAKNYTQEANTTPSDFNPYTNENDPEALEVTRLNPAQARLLPAQFVVTVQGHHKNSAPGNTKYRTSGGGILCVAANGRAFMTGGLTWESGHEIDTVAARHIQVLAIPDHISAEVWNLLDSGLAHAGAIQIRLRGGKVKRANKPAKPGTYRKAATHYVDCYLRGAVAYDIVTATTGRGANTQPNPNWVDTGDEIELDASTRPVKALTNLATRSQGLVDLYREFDAVKANAETVVDLNLDADALVEVAINHSSIVEL